MSKKAINEWVDLKIKHMKIEMKKNRKKYFSLSLTLMLINFATIIIAALAIDKLVESNISNSTAMILSSLSAGFIIIIFFLNAFAIFWKGMSKEKDYKNAIEKIQHEQMLFSNIEETYNGKNANKIFESKCKKIYDDAILKNKKIHKSLLFRVFIGGNDV